MQAVILAGGRGSRLAAMTGGRPKSLVSIAGRPLLHRQIELLARHRSTEMLILVSYGADQIRSSCGDGSAWGVGIRYVEDEEPRGTAGAVLRAYPCLKEHFLVLYGDTVLNVDLGRLWAQHLSSGADATLMVHPNDHPYDSDILRTGSDGRILAIHPCPHPPDIALPNCVNAALYVLARRCLDGIAACAAPFDFAKHLFPLLIERGKLLRAYRSREYIKDAGTPERLARVEADVRSGRVEAGSLESAVPAIFFGRYATLVEDGGCKTKPDQLALRPDASTALRQVNRTRYLSLLVNDRPVAAHGKAEEAGLHRIHDRLEQLLGRENAYLDAICDCPHRGGQGARDGGSESELACDCRSPDAGMMFRAAGEMNIDLAASWLIGGSYADLEAARRAGMFPALVGEADDAAGRPYARRPDFQFASAGAAVSFILDGWPALAERSAAIAGTIRPGTLVLIGGLARSGKSSFASALAWALRIKFGIGAEVISLDGWIKPPERRPKNGTVIDRFDLAPMRQQISEGTAGSATMLRVPLYSRAKRRPERSYALQIKPSDVVILEGVVALLAEFASSRPILRIYVAREEGARRASMTSDYRTRNFSDREIGALYAERQQDETPYVAATRCLADIVVETPSAAEAR